MVNLLDLLNRDIGYNIIYNLIYEDNIIWFSNIPYLKNLCNAIPVLYKSPIYKKEFIDISKEMLITRRYFIGMTQKMKLINYRIDSLGYYDYVNVIFDNYIEYYDDLKYCHFKSYVNDYIEVPISIKKIVIDLFEDLIINNNNVSINDIIFIDFRGNLVDVKKTIDLIRWIDCKEYLIRLSKGDRLHIYNTLDESIREELTDSISIEKCKQEIIKHLYPK